MKIFNILVAGILLSTGLNAQSTEKNQQLVVPLNEPGKPYKLDVHLTMGSITVNAYDGKDVIIDIVSERKRKDDDGEEKNGMKRISSSDNVDITAEQNNNKVSVYSNRPNRGVKLIIKVPKNASDIKLSSTNDANIIVNDVSGALEITSTNGFINLFNVSGSVVANTVNGKVLVTFKSIDPKAAMAFSTLNGNIDITFPADLKANIKAKSDRGQVYTDFDVTVDKSQQPKTTKTNEGNMYRITVEDWIYAKVGGGGPEMMMKNMNGNIYIHKAK